MQIANVNSNLYIYMYIYIIYIYTYSIVCKIKIRKILLYKFIGWLFLLTNEMLSLYGPLNSIILLPKTLVGLFNTDFVKNKKKTRRSSQFFMQIFPLLMLLRVVQINDNRMMINLDYTTKNCIERLLNGLSQFLSRSLLLQWCVVAKYRRAADWNVASFWKIYAACILDDFDVSLLNCTCNLNRVAFSWFRVFIT